MKKQGFTLIELLIVIAIIAILAAVLIPNLLSARKRAFDAAASACAHEISLKQEIAQIDLKTYTILGAGTATVPGMGQTTPASSTANAVWAATEYTPKCNEKVIVTQASVPSTSSFGFTTQHVDGSRTFTITNTGLTDAPAN